MATTMHVFPQHPALRCRTRTTHLARCQSTSSNNVTRTKADALAELQALRAGLGQHLAATETALQSAAGACCASGGAHQMKVDIINMSSTQ